MQFLKDDFKNNRFKSVYLLYGDEPFLIRHYSALFAERLFGESDPLMNSDTFEGADTTARAIMDAADTFPFLSDYRLVYVKDSKLLSTGRKDETDALADYLPALPETTILVFAESQVDKRNRLYKAIAAKGRASECKISGENELVRWVVSAFSKNKKNITAETARLLIHTVPHGMDTLYAEINKLNDYAGTRETIDSEDILTLCTPSLEARIFDLVASVCSGRTETALRQYHNLLLAKEQPLMVLAMIARQFRLVLQCKACAAKRMYPDAISAALNIREYAVREYLEQGKNYSPQRLMEALRDCHDTDRRIKSGLLDSKTGVELLIVRYGNCA